MKYIPISADDFTYKYTFYQNLSSERCWLPHTTDTDDTICSIVLQSQLSEYYEWLINAITKG